MREVVVIGGANLDVKSRSAGPVVAGTSNPGTTVLTPGGVGRNVAENLARLGTPVRLVSAVGDDVLGDLVLAATAVAGVGVAGVRRLPGATATYTAVLDSGGELVAGVSDMSAVDALTPGDVDAAGLSGGAALLVVDGNLAIATLERALELAGGARLPVVLDPVSVAKAERLAGLVGRHPLWAITPNRHELGALGGLAGVHERGVDVVWVRLGSSGSRLSTRGGPVTELSAVTADVVDVTGAGDAMLAAFVHAHLAGATPAEAAAYGHAAAALTVASPHTVRPDLTDDLVRSVLP